MEARIKNMIASQFREARFSLPNVTVTEAEVENYYNANKARYATPAVARAAVILLTVPANATVDKQNEFRARAEAVFTEAKAAVNTQEFAEVVRRHSEDQTTRYRGGEVGWLSSGAPGADPKLVEALLAVEKPGDFASLVYTARGVFIAKLLEKKEAGFKSLPELKESIRYQLARQKTQQAEASIQASIKQGLTIEINQRLVESISLPGEKNEPPKMPGAQTAQLRQ
jgi:parvulin-like peptidyl-prolyl isomerase